MDLSPRQTTTLERPAPVPRRNWRAYVLLAVVLVAGGVVVTKFLTSAIDFYCNVDEVGHKSGCEAGRRLRIQGTVEEGTVQKTGAVTNFVIAFNGTAINVPLRRRSGRAVPGVHTRGGARHVHRAGGRRDGGVRG